MKKLRIISILLALVTLAAFAFTGCEQQGQESETSSTESNKPVSAALVDQIVLGKTYEQVCDILGSEGTDVGSGAILYQWPLDNGKYLHIHFNSHDDVWVVGSIQQSDTASKPLT